MMQCPSCKASVERFNHMHDTAHGIAETHMAGSERFECPECDHILTRGEARERGLTYVLDKQ